MNDPAMLVIAIITAILTWTASVISLVIWLTTRFRSLEKAFYVEMDKHRRENDRLFYLQGTKIQRLEIKAFGFTGPVLENGGGNGGLQE